MSVIPIVMRSSNTKSIFNLYCCTYTSTYAFVIYLYISDILKFFYSCTICVVYLSSCVLLFNCELSDRLCFCFFPIICSESVPIFSNFPRFSCEFDTPNTGVCYHVLVYRVLCVSIQVAYFLCSYIIFNIGYTFVCRVKVVKILELELTEEIWEIRHLWPSIMPK